MGSVRRTDWNRYIPYLLLNIVVSAATMLIVLAVWGRGTPGRNEPLPTATLDTRAMIASSIPPATATVPPSPTPITYTVRSGDTLYALSQRWGISLDDLLEANGLAEGGTLAIGQVLIIPAVEGMTFEQATAAPTAVVDLPRVEIRGVNGIGDLPNESVRLLNSGGVAQMSGWTIDDGEGLIYHFPAFSLHKGAVNVNTRSGTDTVINLFWGQSKAIWSPGKVITLRNASGVIQSTFQIP